MQRSRCGGASLPDPQFFSSGDLGCRCLAGDADSPECCDISSNVALQFINQIMEEDIDEKVSSYQAEAAVRAAGKPFYDILGFEYPPSPEQPSFRTFQSSECTEDTAAGVAGDVNFSDYLTGVLADMNESMVIAGNAEAASRLPVLEFEKGAEEARKFLPEVIGLGAVVSSPEEQTEDSRPIAANEAEIPAFRDRKSHHGDDLDLLEGRSNKQSAVSITEGPIRDQLFDHVLLSLGEKTLQEALQLREYMQKQASRRNSQSRGKEGALVSKPQGRRVAKHDVVDLRTLLMQCAQSVASDDRRTACQLLKQIRQHSSPTGDGAQRLAHCFADGLEARLAGTGSQIYRKLVAKRTSATDMLKAYRLYITACPFKRASYYFSNQTILNVSETASRVHVIDFGIYFGFQWPNLIQHLSKRERGPPFLRITGIDVPQPGFRPSERIEETGRRLADYAESFRVPFQYNGIASNWESIQVEDLGIQDDEVVVVNCMFRFRNLVDESVAMDSPRDRVLNAIRRMKPHAFVLGIVNGSYGVPFFVTRFREVLFHYSALFDMLDTNVPRGDEQRMLIERDLFGKDALNVIACEGSERVERPESYKQWHARNSRAGFMPLPVNLAIKNKISARVREVYHKDFVVDEDNRWLLQGWKGRIIYALSSWKPAPGSRRS